jgi:hypothetical protein
MAPNNSAIDTEFYYPKLGRMYAELSRKYPALVNRKLVLLQQDNDSSHTVRKTKEKLRVLDAIDVHMSRVRIWFRRHARLTGVFSGFPNTNHTKAAILP